MAIHTRQTALLAVFAATALLAGAAQAQQLEEARVVSTVQAPGGGYNVTYEYAGRTYTTRTDSPPGRTIPVQVSAIGVTTSPVYDSNVTPNATDNGRPGWENVTPEPGVVVSGGAAAPGYPAGYAPAPAYAPAPVYVQPSYYPQPYYYPPVGVSLNLGYSRGWGGGWGHGRWR